MKSFLSDWSSAIFVMIVILGLGGGIIYQDIRHTTHHLELQKELIDVYHFNGQLETDNNIRRLQLQQADDTIEQQQRIMDQMYREIMKLRGTPLPEQNPNKSDA